MSASPETVCGKYQKLIVLPHRRLYHIRCSFQKIPCYVFGVCKLLIPPLLTAQRTLDQRNSQHQDAETQQPSSFTTNATVQGKLHLENFEECQHVLSQQSQVCTSLEQGPYLTPRCNMLFAPSPLNSLSPNALETAMTSHTRPSSIQPPTSSTLCTSASTVGPLPVTLCSVVRSTAWPLHCRGPLLLVIWNADRQ